MLRKAGLVVLLVWPKPALAFPDPVLAALQPVPPAPFASRISPLDEPALFALSVVKSLVAPQPGSDPICDLLRKTPNDRPDGLPLDLTDIFAAARTQQGCAPEPG